MLLSQAETSIIIRLEQYFIYIASEGVAELFRSRPITIARS